MTVRDDLIAARDLLVRKGWTQEVLRGMDGSHCAVGAILDSTDARGLIFYELLDREIVSSRVRARAAIMELSKYVPDPSPLDKKKYHNMWMDGEFAMAWDTVATYNNGVFEESVLDLFNRAIASLTEVESMTNTLTKVEILA